MNHEECQDYFECIVWDIAQKYGAKYVVFDYASEDIDLPGMSDIGKSKIFAELSVLFPDHPLVAINA